MLSVIEIARYREELCHRTTVGRLHRTILKGSHMRSLLATGILFLTTASAFARDMPPLALPEPGSMLLIGIAGAAAAIVLRKKK
jgi:hypothetical protein